MRFRHGVWLLALMVLPLQAEVYQCKLNGHTEFSDQPCSEQAQIIELKVQQPQQAAIDAQKAITATFEEESRVNEIYSLNQRNQELEAEIRLLQQQQNAELASLRAKTYTTEDGRIVSTEPGLFKKMDQVVVQYQQQILQVKQQIEQNKSSLNQLFQRAPKE